MDSNIINVLIAEDEEFQQEVLIELLKQYDNINVVGTVKTGDELIQSAIVNKDVAALILDLDLGEGKGGLESYSILKFRGIDLPAILVTANKPEASYSYDLGVIDIVEKPFTPYRLEVAIKKLSNHLSYKSFVENGGVLVPVVNNEEIKMVYPSDILFIQSEKGTVYVNTTNAVIESNISIKVYNNHLFEHNFILTHRSTLVNLRKVSYIDGENVCFNNDDRKAFITEDKIKEVKMITAKFKVTF